MPDLQLFWEAFPAGSGPEDRTTYMFTYIDAEPQRYVQPGQHHVSALTVRAYLMRAEVVVIRCFNGSDSLSIRRSLKHHFICGALLKLIESTTTESREDLAFSDKWHGCRPSLETMLEEYWQLMPEYQGVRLEDLQVLRILFVRPSAHAPKLQFLGMLELIANHNISVELKSLLVDTEI